MQCDVSEFGEKETGMCRTCASTKRTGKCYSANVVHELTRHADPKRAAGHQRFFKTGPGEYGEGDVFMGVSMPEIRAIEKTHAQTLLCMPTSDFVAHFSHMMECRFHEVRMIALLALVRLVSRAVEKNDVELMDVYMKSYIGACSGINNWDLVDLSAPGVAGACLLAGWGDAVLVLDEWAESDNIWLRRIAVLSTLTFVRNGIYKHTTRLAVALLDTPHDLIQKAVGWLLREVGKRDISLLYAFLRTNERFKTMPRTMLRYSIEKVPEATRKKILHGMKF